MKRLQEMVNELSTTNSSKAKKDILLKYEDCKDYLKIILSSFKQFHVTSKNIKKMHGKLKPDSGLEVKTLYELLAVLSKRLVTGHDALRTVQRFVENNSEYSELIFNAIDKNLRCRVDAKLVNKVFDGCVPVWDVALANSYDKLSKSAIPDFEKDKWYVSRKMDGVRCICIRDGDDVKFYSRTGKEFLTLDVVRQEILKLPLKRFVLDGEMCSMENGLEDFQGMMKEIRKKNHQIKNPKYIIFDMLDTEEFYQRYSTTDLTFRLNALTGLMVNYEGIVLEQLKQAPMSNIMNLKSTLEAVDKKGWEGLILRKDVGYAGRRSNELVKCKIFFDEEYEVLGTEIDTMPYFVEDENGVKHEKLEEMMSSIIIKHKGYTVNVGSGWSVRERQRYYKNPEEIIGKTVTIQYKRETVNQDGGISLQFPTLKVVHGDKREV